MFKVHTVYTCMYANAIAQLEVCVGANRLPRLSLGLLFIMILQNNKKQKMGKNKHKIGKKLLLKRKSFP